MFFKMVCFKLKKIDLNPVSIVSSESVETLHYLKLMEHRKPAGICTNWEHISKCASLSDFELFDHAFNSTVRGIPSVSINT